MRGHWIGWVLKARTENTENKEKEGEDYVNVSQQLWSNPEFKKKTQDKKKDRHTNRVQEEIQPHSEK